MMMNNWTKTELDEYLVSKNLSMKDISDELETPQALFNKLNDEFNFDLDLCYDHENNKLRKCDNPDVFQISSLHDNVNAFINPPYSKPYAFIHHLLTLGGTNLVMLLKCDTSTKTWALFWDYEKQEPKEGFEIRFLPKRIRFEYMGRGMPHAAAFPSVIVIKRN